VLPNVLKPFLKCAIYQRLEDVYIKAEIENLALPSPFLHSKVTVFSRGECLNLRILCGGIIFESVCGLLDAFQIA
jgi:hypothetical protein